MTNSTDWLAGYHQALEDAAALVEGHITVPVWGNPPGRVLANFRGKPSQFRDQPRHAYADAIRAIKKAGIK